MELILKAVPVQRGLSNEHVSYVTSLSFGDVVRLLDDEHLYVPNEPDLPDFAQRKPNPVRVKAIADIYWTLIKMGVLSSLQFVSIFNHYQFMEME